VTVYSKISSADVEKRVGAAELSAPPPLTGVCYGGPAAAVKRREVLFYLITKQGGALLALIWCVTQPTGWVEWSGFAVFYVLNLLGINIGFHRYFAHRSFKTSRPMRWVLGVWFQLGGFGSLRSLIADHRRHHACADQPGDPHSPYFDGHGRPLEGRKGFKHAHAGWIFEDTTTDLAIYGKGLLDDPVISFCHRTRIHWYIVSAVLLPALWGYGLGGTGAILGTVLIAGFLRLTAALHGFVLVNSLGHVRGSKSFEAEGEARNNLLVAIVSLGEGWHNNHHAYPRVAFHGHNWREPDPTAWVIMLFERLGLVWDVQRPKKAIPHSA
jgi:stearoyl-CoA desaturase (delta-9 desaturase)